MFHTLLLRLKNFNIFESSVTANNEYELRNEQISTRVFIILLIVSLIIILTYTFQVSITKTIEVKQPSFDQFQALSLRYSETLHCPCDNVAISYESFIVLEARFHQICTSDFLTQNWVNYLSSAADIIVSDDFSYTSVPIFNTLASFCHLANATIMNALETFKSTQFISAEVLTKDVFTEHIDAIIQNFQSSIELTYYQLFDLTQYSTRINQLMSSLFSDLRPSFDMSTYNKLWFWRCPYQNNTCFCYILKSCFDPLTLRDRRTTANVSSSSFLFTIPGLYKGCYLVEAVRHSTLECFYQTSCIATIEQFLQASYTLNSSIQPLNPFIQSRFNISSTIDQLLSKAMTEEWEESVFYMEYFSQCQLSYCIYSFTSKFNAIYIITTLIGLIGGLTKVLRFIVPRVVRFIRRRLVPPPTAENKPRK